MGADRAALVRHPTPAVAPGLCYGRLDVPLAAGAAHETQAIIAALAGWQGAAVWSSPSLRCRIPATAIAGALGAAPPGLDPRLRELDFGLWEGQPWSAVPRPALDAWAAAPLDFVAPGGEPARALIARVTDFWDALPAGAHIVVTHGGPLKILAALARGEAIDLMRPTQPFAALDLVVSRPAEPGGRGGRFLAAGHNTGPP